MGGLASLYSHLQNRIVEVICSLCHLPFLRHVVKVIAEKDSTFRCDFKHFLYVLTGQLLSVYCNSISHAHAARIPYRFFKALTLQDGVLLAKSLFFPSLITFRKEEQKRNWCGVYPGELF